MGGEKASGGYGVGEYGVWVVSKLLGDMVWGNMVCGW